MKPLHFKDIPQFTSWGNYAADQPWTHIEAWIASQAESQESMGKVMELDPDFQRGHVWDDSKRSKYVEFILCGGKSGRDILWNCPGWMSRQETWGDLVLVDGKQRLEAVRQFLKGEVTAFGRRIDQFEGKPGYMDCSFRFHVNNLETRAEVLQWYLDINDGGVVHTEDELGKVRELLKREKG